MNYVIMVVMYIYMSIGNIKCNGECMKIYEI